MSTRPPLPPFTEETARQKVQAAENAWNTRDPEKVSLAYTEDSVWRNRGTQVTGREEIVKFLTAKWQRELEYALRKELWTFGGNRIAVRFHYESRDATGQWWRSSGNELWEFDDNGLMSRPKPASTTSRSRSRTGASSAAALIPTASRSRSTSRDPRSRRRD